MQMRFNKRCSLKFAGYFPLFRYFYTTLHLKQTILTQLSPRIANNNHDITPNGALNAHPWVSRETRRTNCAEKVSGPWACLEYGDLREGEKESKWNKLNLIQELKNNSINQSDNNQSTHLSTASTQQSGVRWVMRCGLQRRGVGGRRAGRKLKNTVNQTTHKNIEMMWRRNIVNITETITISLTISSPFLTACCFCCQDLECVWAKHEPRKIAVYHALPMARLCLERAEIWEDQCREVN